MIATDKSQISNAQLAWQQLKVAKVWCGQDLTWAAKLGVTGG